MNTTPKTKSFKWLKQLLLCSGRYLLHSQNGLYARAYRDIRGSQPRQRCRLKKAASVGLTFLLLSCSPTSPHGGTKGFHVCHTMGRIGACTVLIDPPLLCDEVVSYHNDGTIEFSGSYDEFRQYRLTSGGDHCGY